MLNATLEVFLYELKRSITIGRILVWGLLSMLPLAIFAVVVFQARMKIPLEAISLMAFILIPQVSCMLGQILWATPSVQSELEGQTWIYLTMRPHGKLAVLFGKYLVSVVWGGTLGTLSAVGIGVLTALSDVTTNSHSDAWHLSWTLICLVWLASLCYAAIYQLIGVVILKRSSIAAMTYSFIMEGAVAFLPATINQFSISYRLRSLLAQWLEFDALRERSRVVFGTEPASQQVLILLVIATLVVGLSSILLRFREIPMSTEY